MEHSNQRNKENRRKGEQGNIEIRGTTRTEKGEQGEQGNLAIRGTKRTEKGEQGEQGNIDIRGTGEQGGKGNKGT